MKKSYPVVSPFRHKTKVFRGGDISLTAEEAKPLLRAGLISDPEETGTTDDSGTDTQTPGTENTGSETPSSGTESTGPETTGDDATQEQSQEQLFAAAVLKLEPGNEEHWTAAEKPDVRALESVGFKCTAKERDALWDAYQAKAK